MRHLAEYFRTCLVIFTCISGAIGYGSLGLNPQNPGSGRYRATNECVLVRHLAEYFRACLVIFTGIGGAIGYGSLGLTPQNPGSGRYRATTVL